MAIEYTRASMITAYALKYLQDEGSSTDITYEQIEEKLASCVRPPRKDELEDIKIRIEEIIYE